MSVNKLRLIAGASLLILGGTGGGCATFWGGTRQTVDFDSRPSGASLFVNGDFVGKTPVAVKMDQQQHPLVVLEKDGYASTRVLIEPGFNKFMAADMLVAPLLFFSIPATLIDVRAGAARGYSETDIVVPLLPPGSEERKVCGGNVLLKNFSSPYEDLPSKKQKKLNERKNDDE